MLESQVNLITGDRKSGRSMLLLSLSEYIEKSGNKIYFVGATHEFKDSVRMLKGFSGYDFFNSSESNNLLIIEKINEIITKNNFSVLIVDDIDYLSDKIINKLLELPIKKIVSCLYTKLDIFKVDFEEYKISNEYDYTLMKNIQTLTNHNNTYLVDDIFKSFSRTEKINSILDDKS